MTQEANSFTNEFRVIEVNISLDG